MQLGRMSISLASTPERLHQAEGVAVGFLGRGKAGHRVGQDMGAGQLQQIHRPGGDDQGVRGVEPAGDADDDLVDSRGFQTLGQSLNLDVVGLVAALIPLGGVRRDVGKAGVFPVEEETPLDRVQISRSTRRNFRRASRWVRAFRPKLVWRIRSWARRSRSRSARMIWELPANRSDSARRLPFS